MPVPTPDQLTDRVAARQHGLVLRRQARAAGLSPRQIDRRLQSGRWRLAARGVYAVAAVPAGWRQDALAACLSRADTAVASHLTAAALHGLARPPSTPHITVPAGAGRSPLAVVHRAPLDVLDVVRIDGMSVTGVSRTLIDCAGLLGDAQLAGIVDAALCDGLSHPRDIVASLSRAQSDRGKPGVARLRRVLEVWMSGVTPESPAEARLVRQIVEWGFEAPELQIELRDSGGRFVGRIDMGWRRVRLGLEYDGDLSHSPRRWSQDETRQLAYAAAGWDVHRVDKYDLRAGQPRLRELLQRRLGRRAA
jgi:hypothetical protein